jgi:abortive infection bacteriophage resistance protein
MIMEIMPLGTWSRVYEGLAGQNEQKSIAGRFNVGIPIFRSWIQCISIIRNICAHHMRLWNRHFVVRPKSVFAGSFEIKDNPTFYAQAAVIQRLLSVIAPGSIWGRRLFETLANHPNVEKRNMGFPLNWERNPFWGVQIPPRSS